MQITVFGATGRVGSQVTKKLLASGHSVNAFVHRTAPDFDHPNLQIVRGDIRDSEAVRRAVSGSDAVVSCLSSWGASGHHVLTSAMTSLIPAMKDQGITRIVSLTGAEARAAGDKYSLIHRISHFGLSIVAGGVLRDGEEHIRRLSDSGLEWTVIRSPIMTSGAEKAERFMLTDSRPLPWQTIPRGSVANAMVAEVFAPAHTGRAPFIRRS